MNPLIAAQMFPKHYPFRGTGALINVAVTPRDAIYGIINGSLPRCLVFYGKTQNTKIRG